MKNPPALLLAALLAASTSTLAAQDARVGMPWDWSHRAVIQNPDLPEEAMAKGEYDAWLRKTADPRYLSALVRKVEAAAMREAEAGDALTAKARNPRANRPNPGRNRRTQEEINRDWSNVMGGAAGVGVRGTFPAKYAFDINAAADCANDFVVYGSGSAGATGAGAFASRTGTFSGSPGGGTTVTITNGTRVLTLTRSNTQNDGLFFQTANAAGNTNAERAANLAAAINRNGGTVGVRATSSGATVTVTSLTQGAASNAIAIADSMNNNFNWAGATLTGGGGTAGQPTIFAVNQLYKVTCDDAANPPVRPLPNTFWSYNTGTGGVVQTSPLLSLDGSQVAFIETTGGVASLVILKWSSTVSVGTIGAPTVPSLAGSAAAYRACAAPCMYKLSLGANNVKTITGFNGDTNSWGSSPYYDYETDTLYVGTATGVLHKFNGVFLGNPAPAGGSWPVTVAAGLQLSSPVFANGRVYVGSERSAGVVGAGTGGRLHSLDANGGTPQTSAELAKGPFDNSGSTGVADAPMIDTFAQRAYVFVASSTDMSCTGVECAAVVQIPINASINGVAGTRSVIGRGQLKERVLYMGAFNDGYWASNPSSPTGFLYVCGSEAPFASSRRPTLWRIPVTNNVMGAAVVGPQLVNGDSFECSPITEVSDGSADRIFVSVPSNGSAAGCAGSCIYMYNLAGAWGPGKAAAAGLAAPGGTGGIIIDNISSATGASQIYYATQTSPGNAIQASQAALN